MTPCVLVIAGSDPSGGAGIQLDAQALAAAGCHAATVVTAVTAQNSVGVTSVISMPTETVVAQLEAVVSDLSVGVVKIGMTASAENAIAIADWLRQSDRGLTVLDPVMMASDGTLLAQGVSDSEELADSLRRLVSDVDVVTPNIAEAAMLLSVGEDQILKADPLQAAAAIKSRAGGKLRWVYMKGGHREGRFATDMLFDGQTGSYLHLEADRIDKKVRGTGCFLASSLAGYLARGLGMADAARRSKAAVTEAIMRAEPLGRGSAQIISPSIQQEGSE